MTRASIRELRRTRGSVVFISSLSAHFGQASEIGCDCGRESDGMPAAAAPSIGRGIYLLCDQGGADVPHARTRHRRGAARRPRQQRQPWQRVDAAVGGARRRPAGSCAHRGGPLLAAARSHGHARRGALRGVGEEEEEKDTWARLPRCAEGRCLHPTDTKATRILPVSLPRPRLPHDACDQIGEVVLHLATAGYTTGLDYLCTGGAELGYAPRKVTSK